MLYERFKFFLLILPLMPMFLFAQAQDTANGIADGMDGAYQRGWGAWTWFWIIVVIAAVALLIWWISSRGRPQQRGQQ